MTAGKFRLTIVREGEDVWSKEFEIKGFDIVAIGFHILSALFGGGELILKPNRPIPKSEIEQLERLAE
jgi:hypothetical protein